MALRFSYRISPESLNNGTTQQPGQNVERDHGAETSGSEPHPDHSKASMQTQPASCIDLLTSF